MARIAGVDIPRDKKVVISLQYIYGLGTTQSRRILEKSEVNPDTKVKDLTEGEAKEVVNG